jgi:hypothetical protein
MMSKGKVWFTVSMIVLAVAASASAADQKKAAPAPAAHPAPVPAAPAARPNTGPQAILGQQGGRAGLNPGAQHAAPPAGGEPHQMTNISPPGGKEAGVRALNTASSKPPIAQQKSLTEEQRRPESQAPGHSAQALARTGSDTARRPRPAMPGQSMEREPEIQNSVRNATSREVAIGGKGVPPASGQRQMAKYVTPSPNFGPSHDVTRERDFIHAHEHDFHTRDVRGFDERERMAWQSGRWGRDWHYGRYGWWYSVDGVWYPYETPVYPYPLVVSDVEVHEANVVEEPGAGTVAEEVGDAGSAAAPEGGQPPPQTTSTIRVAGPSIVTVTSAAGARIDVAPLPAAPQATYRCASPSGVYPEVRQCATAWTIEP